MAVLLMSHSRTVLINTNLALQFLWNPYIKNYEAEMAKQSLGKPGLVDSVSALRSTPPPGAALPTAFPPGTMALLPPQRPQAVTEHLRANFRTEK